MIKQFMAKTCAFDAEWVPCGETGRRLLGLPKGMAEALNEEIVRKGDRHSRRYSSREIRGFSVDFGPYPANIRIYL